MEFETEYKKRRMSQLLNNTALVDILNKFVAYEYELVYQSDTAWNGDNEDITESEMFELLEVLGQEPIKLMTEIRKEMAEQKEVFE